MLRKIRVYGKLAKVLGQRVFEAAEAVMPLTRGPGGRLGVDASGAGGGDITVNVSVDATGSRVQGDDAQGPELGRLIGAALHQEILKQKRPGGLLAS
jgi:phage-related minor tail protein